MPVNSPFISVAEGSVATIVRSAGLPAYTISSNTVLGTAEAVDMQTGVDVFGSLLRVPRMFGEDDLLYLGRLQRLLIVSSRRGFSGSSPFITQTLSALFGRMTISQPWDGVSSSPLPGDTSFLDLLDPPEVMESSDISFDAKGLVGVTSVDLTGYHFIRAAKGVLWQGRDYLVQSDSTFVLTSAFAGPYSIVAIVNKARVLFSPGRADRNIFTLEFLPSRFKKFVDAAPDSIRASSSATIFPFTPSALVAGTSTVPGGCILRGKGLFTLGTDRAEKRMLMRSGGALKTTLGHSLLDSPSTKWSTIAASGHLVPLDI